ncbi:glycine zipper domain-containing protein [Crenobacter cavernae]|uniref:Glycine zipper domain-containing protein n=1 Tax=Crenobacter cavernae TaxID=2290923 RepID=A0A345Y2U6_9NEIS|nr:glycine zipper domain-containing protein [Crenobacter cavernae]AXK38248.1 hypothetical protein DWG20_01685 [Crenobacter cavernae]
MFRKYLPLAALVLLPLSFGAQAGGEILLGGALGGAAGAAIGDSLGGRDGAVIGGALGGAVGAGIGHDYRRERIIERRVVYEDDRPYYRSRYDRDYGPRGHWKHRNWKHRHGHDRDDDDD